MTLLSTRRAGSVWPESMQSLLGTVVIAVFVVTFIVQAFQIPSESMENTLLIGDYLLVDKLHFGGGGFWGHLLPYEPVKRGDIVVFHYPVHPVEHFVKRVVAIPGDRLRLINRRVYVNGSPVAEPYVHYSRPHDPFRDEFPRLDVAFVPSLNGSWLLQMKKLTEDNQLIVPQGNYFVMGDNRDDSLDSRYWGFVPRENIVGRPLVIYWSMRNPDPPPGPVTAGDKLYRLFYALSHIMQITRWDRTLRLVR
ncbi:MAG TPA: signal peptidase I [Terriglobales bacterium]|jgi:signal peptidase I|nr:signal peptidase I [Terriglobales bacterium]